MENEVVQSEKIKHSGMGIATFVASIVISLSIIICYFNIAFRTVALGGAVDKHSSFMIVTGLIIFGLLMFDMIVLGLGIVGIFQKDQKKIYAILGIIISASMILTVASLKYQIVPNTTTYTDPYYAIKVGTIIVGILSLLLTLRAHFYVKSQDILLSYFDKYTSLVKWRRKNKRTNFPLVFLKKKHKKAEEYYHLFWHLQHEQFTFWRRGFLPTETYRFWLKRRLNEWIVNDYIFGVRYQEGWKETKQLYSGSDFFVFFDKLYGHDCEKKISIDELVQKYGPKWYNLIIPGLPKLRRVKSNK